MSMIRGLNMTSKASLKQFCLLTSNGDVDKASKMYDFLVKDMDGLPTFDPVKPTAMQNIKTTATDIFSFLKENGDEIQQGIDIIRSMFGKGGHTSNVTHEELPPIN